MKASGPIVFRFRLGAIQQLHAALGQTVQELDHIEVLDHRVGQLDERLNYPLLACHDPISISSAANANIAIMEQLGS